MKSLAQISLISKRFIKAMHLRRAQTLNIAQKIDIFVHARASMHKAYAFFVPYAQNNQYSVHNIPIHATQ